MDVRASEPTSQPADRQSRILGRGLALFEAIGDRKPGLFDRGFWAGKALEWAMGDERFKTRLFRFIDVLPSLIDDHSLARHVKEYFADAGGGPAVFHAGLVAARAGGGLGLRVFGKALRSQVHGLAGRFIIGSSPSRWTSWARRSSAKRRQTDTSRDIANW